MSVDDAAVATSSVSPFGKAGFTRPASIVSAITIDVFSSTVAASSASFGLLSFDLTLKNSSVSADADASPMMATPVTLRLRGGGVGGGVGDGVGCGTSLTLTDYTVINLFVREIPSNVIFRANSSAKDGESMLFSSK